MEPGSTLEDSEKGHQDQGVGVSRWGRKYIFIKPENQEKDGCN